MRYCFALLAFALCLTGCSVMPATRGDVDSVREDVKKAAEAQSDTYRDHLIADPLDTQGATAAAFGANVGSLGHLAQEASEKRQAEDANPPWWINTALGLLGLGAAGYVSVKGKKRINEAVAEYDAAPDNVAFTKSGDQVRV